MASPALAPPQVIDVTLSLFGGRKTDIAPADCPEGLSPDEQDNVFLPGDVQSRPGLARLFAPGQLTPGTSVFYAKTYVQPNGDPLTLILTSDGKLWVEDVGNAPGVAAALATVPQGLYAQSVTAFGREYIAFSDLLHGQGIPLQYDGTNLDRVTQDGPGVGPTVQNVIPAAATIASPGFGLAIAIASSPTGIVWGGSLYGGLYYAYFTVTTSAPHGLAAGELVTFAGTSYSQINAGNFVVTSVTSATVFVVDYQFGVANISNPNGGGGTVETFDASLSRTNNVVIATTNAPHGFAVGWQVQISGLSDTVIGGGIAAIARDGNGVVTVTTTTAHGLVQGSQVAIIGVSNPDTSFNVNQIAVASVPSPTTFTYQQAGTVEASSGATGNVEDIWNITAFIQSVPSPTTFTYQQTGPNDTTTGGGTATIIGQISPGTHKFVVINLTRNGALTPPSPPVLFGANGGAQAALSNIPIGPSDVVARLIGATGAGGDNFFTIPATPQVGGQIVGSSFIIPDNTSTSAVLDFSDNTLFDGVAIDQVGNDLFDQRVLGPVLGFFAYASRLFTWGDYQKIENLLGMGFDSGYVSTTPNTPTGWTNVDGLGNLVNGGAWVSGQAWQITTNGVAGQRSELTQPAYQDVSGTAILQPITLYWARVWAQRLAPAPTVGGGFSLELSSPSVGSLAIASFPIATISAVGQFYIVPFTVATPAVIPADTILRVYGSSPFIGALALVDELELVYAQNPYTNTLARGSYVLNPEGFAQTTGNIGPTDDQSPIRCFARQRMIALLKTGEGRHTIQDNNYEPDQWNVEQVSLASGAVSLRAGDPGKFGTGDGAVDWDATASKDGVYLYAGADFWKISQEISRGALPQSQDPRPTWDDIDWSQQQKLILKNDTANRRILISVPLIGAIPSGVFVMDYRELDTATQIASSPPLHITIQGKMKSSDLTRKWSFWNVSASAMEVLVRPGNQRAIFFGGGVRNGNTYGNVYSLNPLQLTDDDYGAIKPYYTTFAFVDHDQEQALGLGSDGHLYKQIHAFITGVGTILITPIANSLYNFKPSLSPRILVSDTNVANFLNDDLEWTIAGLRAARMFFRISVQPLPGATDVQYRVQKFITHMMKDPIAPFRQSGV